MSYEHILFTLDAGIARLTLNRPDRLNSFNDAMHAEVRDALAYLRSGGENRAKAHTLLKLSLADSDYAKEADGWLKAPADAKPATFAHRCIGCHT